MSGYMWKKDRKGDDKKTIKRFLFNKDSYKRRYFVLDDVKLELKYYTDSSKKTELGCIDLLSVSMVSSTNVHTEHLPSKFPLCLIAEHGDWSMCCENEEDFHTWNQNISKIMQRREECRIRDSSGAESFFSQGSTRDSMNLQSLTPIQVNEIQRTVMEESEYKSKGPTSPHNGSRNVIRKSITKAKQSFLGKRRSNLPNDSFNNDMLQMQRTRLGEESVYNSYTGNVSIAATATFSRFISMEKLDFFQVLMSSCDDHCDISTRQQLVTTFLSECQFEFYTEEGEILINEGCKFEWVYFVLEGEIEQRKNWTSSPHHIDEKITTGKCAGFVEVLHFNGVSATTLLVGPGTICLKMSVAIFKKQFQQHVHNDKAIFSTSMDASCTLYKERLTAFTFKRLSNLPLLERQPIANIQTLSHIFSPVLIASGDHLMNEGDASDDFYIILQGSCNVFQKSSLDSDEMDEIVRSCRGGDWLGEAGLINIQSRLITAVACSDVVALRTNAAGFKRFLDIVGPSVREVITKSTTSYLKSTLKSIPLFSNIDEDQIVDICREVSIKELDRDTLLYDSGDKLEELHVILHGLVKCSISFVSGLDLSESPPFIDTMRENDFFGESAVLYDSSPSRLQYFTPKDVKVIVLCIPAKKLKPFLPLCPILQLRFEERLMVRKTHMDLIDTLVNSISASLSTRHDYRGSAGISSSTTRARSSSKQSLGHMADTKAKDSLNMTDEVLYLREEVKRLNGVQFAETQKGRSQSRVVSTLRSTFKKIKSGYISTPKSPKSGSARVPEKKKTQPASKQSLLGQHSPLSGSQSRASKDMKSFSIDFEEDIQNAVVLNPISDNLLAFTPTPTKDDERKKIELTSDSDDDDDDDDGYSTDSSVEIVYTFDNQKPVLDALSRHSDLEEVVSTESRDSIRKEKMLKILNEDKDNEKREKEEKEKKEDDEKRERKEQEEKIKKEKEDEMIVKIDRSIPSSITTHTKKVGVASSLSQKTPASKKETLPSSSSDKVTASPRPAAVTVTVTKPIRSQTETAPNSQGDSYAFDAMYARMLSMKLPEAAIRKKMNADGVPLQFIDLFFQDNVAL